MPTCAALPLEDRSGVPELLARVSSEGLLDSHLNQSGGGVRRAGPPLKAAHAVCTLFLQRLFVINGQK